MDKVKDILKRIKTFFINLKDKIVSYLKRDDNVFIKIKDFFVKLFKSIKELIINLISKFKKELSEDEIKDKYKTETNINVLKRYEKIVSDTKLKKKITKRIEDLKVKNKEEKETIIEEKEYSRLERNKNIFNKNIDDIDKKMNQIKDSYKDETTLSILNLYKKQCDKLINKLEKIENKQSREDVKIIKEKIEEIKELKYDINEQEKSLEVLDIPKVKRVKKKQASETNIDRFREKSLIALEVVKKGAIKTGKGIKKVSKKAANKTGIIINNIKKEIDKKKKINEEKKILINNVKYLNKKINVFYTKISNIKSSTTRLQELLLLKEKILDLRDNYDKLTRMKGFRELSKNRKVNKVDPNHLIHHDKAIYDLIDYINNTIEIEKNKPKDIIINTQEKVQKKEFHIDETELSLVRNSITKDIESSLKDIDKIKKDIDDIPLKHKKLSLLQRIDNFFKYSMNTAISLIPFGLFRSKLVATLTSGIIINNRIRTMNSLMKQKDVTFINYDAILNSISNKKTCLENTSYVLEDTIEQIDMINSNLVKNYSDHAESLKLMKQLEEMKADLLEEDNKIEGLLEDIRKEKNKEV